MPRAERETCMNNVRGRVATTRKEDFSRAAGRTLPNTLLYHSYVLLVFTPGVYSFSSTHFSLSIPTISALLLLHAHLLSSPSSRSPQFCTPFFIFLTVLQSHTPPLHNVQSVWWTQEGARRGLRLKVEGYRGEEDPRCSSRGHKCHYDRSCTGLSSLPFCTRAHTVRAP